VSWYHVKKELESLEENMWNVLYFSIICNQTLNVDSTTVHHTLPINYVLDLNNYTFFI